jgi:hypothetical protein
MNRLFGDVLIKHSPNIEEISILTNFPYPVSVLDGDQLANARWQNLRKFCLGNVFIDQSPARAPYVTFLEAHPKLNSIQLSKHTLAFLSLSAVSTQALPDITNFGGTLHQLERLPHIHSRLKTLSLCDPISTLEFNAATVLRNMTALTDLRISFNPGYEHDNTSLLHSLIATCPQLERLDLSCVISLSFHVVSRHTMYPFFNSIFHTVHPSPLQHSFSETIRGFTKLRHVSLALVKRPGEGTLSTGAERIARANPWLQTFTLTYLTPPYRTFYSIDTLLPEVEQSGTYTLSCDEHGFPKTLIAHERRNVALPCGLGTRRSSKKYIKDLRPLGCPGQAKRGFWWLVVENTVAGEEARMILFCFFLLGLAAWGILAQKTQ